MDWNWIGSHGDLFGNLIRQHVLLAIVPVLLGLLISVPLGIACVRYPRLYAPGLAVATVLYAVPSLALFVCFISITGLTEMTAIWPLTIYTLALLLRNVVDGLNSVPTSVSQAATAMGFGDIRRLLQIDLPVAVPVILAGIRVAMVSNISLVSVASLIGLGGLGQLFIDGFQRAFPTEIIAGIVLIVVIAFLADSLLVLVQRVLTPWSQSRKVHA